MTEFQKFESEKVVHIERSLVSTTSFQLFECEPKINVLIITPSLPTLIPSITSITCLLQEDARADVVDCVVRDIQNCQCLLNVEYSGATCPHVTIQFGDTKDDVGLGLVKEGLVMVDVRKEKYLQKMVSIKNDL